ncbi:MAG: hypothetical protein KAU06_02510, partial [Candidatus Marinimicrobia bacterium]|nr:hypothetical protein [Candidatus Neomarinimicrobiota bacterium]
MKRFIFFNVVFGIVFLSFVSSNAAVIESNSGTTGDRTWNNKYVWVGDVVPSSTDTVIINGLVTVDIKPPATFTSCGKLTVNSGAILRDYQGSVLHVNSEIVNNGTIENSYDGTYHLTLKVSGDITNNGTWKNSFTYFNGAVAQHLSATSEFSGGNFISENSADTLVIDSDLSFNNTYVDLNNDELRLQGNKLSIKNGYIEKANIIGDNGELYMNGTWYDGAYSHNACLINSTVSNNITLTGIAAVNSGVVFKGTVIVEDTLQNDFYNPFTLQIDGDIINNGLIRDANQFSALALNIDGNITNNGEWTNLTTNLSGSNTQHLTFSSPFSGYYLYDTDSSSSILADSDLHFHNCHIDLDSAEFDLQGHQLSFTGEDATYPYDLRSATIVANGGSLFLNKCVYLYKTVLDGITLLGEVQVKDVIFEGTTTVEDTLENEYQGSGPIDINGNIINNGLIRNYPNYTTMTLNITGNMTNNGEWTNLTTNLSGSNAQHLTFSSPFSGYYLYDTDSSSSILADSDLHFHNCYIDLDSAEFDLQGHQLSFTGEDATYPYDLRSTTIVANGGSLFLNNYVYLYKTILDGITLRGEVQVKNVIFEGTTIVEDTLENEYRGSDPIDINGNIINNGLIRDYPNYTTMTLNITGNMTNNGEWANSLTELKGDTKQHIVVVNSQTIDNQVKLNAVLSGDTYQWLLDDVEIADATSQILTFNSIGEPEFGPYICRVTSSGKETNYSRMIRISNGSPKLSALPDTNFIEDHSLKLPVSFLFDYVEDPNDADTTLIWMIEDNDDVVSEIIADTISFSSPTNWFGVDTLSVIVSDGELTDTTNLIVTVEPENDAPVIVALPDTSVFEDDSLCLELSAIDIDTDTLEFTASSDTAAIELKINQNLLTLIPIENWSGNSA